MRFAALLAEDIVELSLAKWKVGEKHFFQKLEYNRVVESADLTIN
jgi:hypothetical protein